MFSSRQIKFWSGNLRSLDGPKCGWIADVNTQARYTRYIRRLWPNDRFFWVRYLYVSRLILIMKVNYHLPKKHLTLQHGVSRYSTIASCARNCTIITVLGSENLDCIFSLCYSTVILYGVVANEHSIYRAPSR